MPVADPPVESERLGSALRRAAWFGRCFDADLAAAPEDPLDVDAAVDAARRRLGTTEARVAASALQYEIAERAWSLTLGAWAFGRIVPDLTQLRFGTGDDGTAIAGFERLRGWDCADASSDDVAELLGHNVVDVVLREFHTELRRSVKIADGLLWGNAAAALVLTARSAGRARSCVDVTVALLRHPHLAGRVEGPSMRRRTCCLYYRTSAGRVCGDCPLPHVQAGSGRLDA